MVTRALTLLEACAKFGRLMAASHSALVLLLV